jgi:branched-subunit amino acid aminotransferase/4-amino-4-deoxychorismate lyase
MLAWKNGVFCEVADGITVAQMHQGLSLFETFALREGKVECLEFHWQRLALSCAHLGIQSDQRHLGHLSKTAEWSPVLQRLLRAESLSQAIVRLVIVPTSQGSFDEWVTVRPLPDTPAKLDLFLLSTVRDEAEWMPRPKSGPWQNSAEALRELQSITSRTDVEGVQCDSRGCVSEATRSSLLWREGNRWFAPAPSTQRLPGTAALQFIDYLKHSGQSVTEVTQSFPLQAESMVVLRSTFLGGAVLASRCQRPTGETLWQADADQTSTQKILQEFARWRTQRSLKLL